MSPSTTASWKQVLFLCFLSLTLSGASAAAPLNVPIPGKQSILRVGAIPDPVTDTRRAIAQRIMGGLEKGDKTQLLDARRELEAIMDQKNLGGGDSAMRWMLNVLLAPDDAHRASFIKNPLDQAYVDFFFAEDFARLKEYLQRKFGVNNFTPEDPEVHVRRTEFLDDMVMFNNPDRSTWDSVAQVMSVINGLGPDIKRVVDVGAGFGFYSYRLAQMVGDTGTVYAADTSESYIDQLQKFVRAYPLGRIAPTLSTEDDIKASEKVDLVFISSLYHVIYSWSQHAKRDPFLRSVHNALRDNGYLVILDNSFNSGRELHNSYIEKDYVIAQLYYYGFELADYKSLSDTRYVLVFRKAPSGTAKRPVFADEPGGKSIPVNDSRSVVHIGSLDSFDITPAGISAAKDLYRALDGSDPTAARAAIGTYDKLIPNENFGGEYTALRWVATYLVASDDSRKVMTQDPLVAEYLAYLSENNYERLKFFLSRKYKLGIAKLTAEEAADEETRKIGIVQRQSLEDFILFNNPEREGWEKSSLILEKLPLKPGDTIVDVGSGPGYFTFKFSNIVGERGKVYALDTKKPHIDYIEAVIKRWGTSNVVPILSANDNLNLDAKGAADVVFMCSLYHILYAVSSVEEREAMLTGIWQVLKPGGKLVIVDNGPVEEQQLPYHGPYIRKELIQAQLEEYGFVLVETEQVVPQRYMLVFERPS
jgi:predicted methyltransferase